jgi:hypothetical protein
MTIDHRTRNEKKILAWKQAGGGRVFFLANAAQLAARLVDLQASVLEIHEAQAFLMTVVRNAYYIRTSGV